MSTNPFDQFDAPAQAERNPFDQFDSEQAPAKPKTRTWTEAGTDTARSVLAGLNSLAKLPAMAIDKAVSGQTMGPGVEALNAFGDSIQSGKSDLIKEEAAQASQRTKARGQAVEEGFDNLMGTKGQYSSARHLTRFLTELGSGAYEGVTNPRLLVDQVAQSLPMLKVSQVVGRGAGAVADKVAPAVASKVATGGAVAAGAAMQGSDVGTETFQRLMAQPDEAWAQDAEYRERAARVGFEQAKQELASERATAAGLKAGAASVASSFLPGGTAMEKALVAKSMAPSLKGAAQGFAGEFAQEAIEEGSGQLLQNKAVATVDRNMDPMEGVGEAAGMGGIVGGVMGAGTTGGRMLLTQLRERYLKPGAPPPARSVLDEAPARVEPTMGADDAAAPASRTPAPAQDQAAAPEAGQPAPTRDQQLQALQGDMAAVNALLQEATDDADAGDLVEVAESLKAQHQALAKEGDAPLPPIAMSEDRLAQVMVNLNRFRERDEAGTRDWSNARRPDAGVLPPAPAPQQQPAMEAAPAPAAEETAPAPAPLPRPTVSATPGATMGTVLEGKAGPGFGAEVIQRAADLVQKTGKASAPALARELGGSPKQAAGLLEQLQAAGVVSAPNALGGRTVLAKSAEQGLGGQPIEARPAGARGTQAGDVVKPAVVKESLTTGKPALQVPDDPKASARAAIDAETLETRANVPEVAQPTKGKRVTVPTQTLDGVRNVQANLYELPGYNGPQLAVRERKTSRGTDFMVYLPKSGAMVANSNGVSTLEDTLKLAVLRIQNARDTLGAKKVQPAQAQAGVPAEGAGGSLPTPAPASELDSAKLENLAVRSSLSADSAYEVRIQRAISQAKNAPESAKLAGFYDRMLGRESRAKEYGEKLAVSYMAGQKQADNKRTILKGKPWTETDLERNGSKWDWRVYREGRFVASGSAPSQAKAEEAAFAARFDDSERGRRPPASQPKPETPAPKSEAPSQPKPEAAARPDSATEKAAQPEPAQHPTDKVENFGEKLPPARRALAAKLSEGLTDDAIGALPLSQIWPAAENEAIEDPFAAVVAHVMREAVPAKPRVAYKLKSWVDKVQTLRGFAAQILRGDVSREAFISELGKAYALRDMGAKIKLLEKIERADWKRIGDVSEAPNAIRYEEGKQISSPYVSVAVDGKSHWLNGSGDVLAHLDGIKAMLAKDAPGSRMQFEIRQESRGERKVFVNKKGDKEQRRLLEFATVEEARKAITERYDDLVAAWESVKDRDNITERDLRSAENRERRGKDHRQGRDVTAQEFADRFGFRGGEFGNWVSQGKGAQERQAMLNNAYDALSDLADILGVPPKAISLEGSLGIAFGSRGSGWASAHFEPSNLVINLTKTRGAGALAHEWFHALDNYFARKRGGEVPFKGDQAAYRRDNYITYKTAPLMVRKDGRGHPLTKERLAEWRKSSPDSAYLSPDQWTEDPAHKQGVRVEVEQAFDGLVQALNASPMFKRAKVLDGSGTDGYWARVIERAARAFENYVQARMLEQGFHNDFLANVKAAPEVGKNVERYPYLLPGEVAPIAEAFDSLFKTIEAREDEGGKVALMSRSPKANEQEARALAELSKHDDLFALKKSYSVLPQQIARDIESGMTVQKVTPDPGKAEQYKITTPNGEVAWMYVRTPSPFGPTLYGFDMNEGEMVNVYEGRPGENPEDVDPDTQDVYIDASRLTGRGDGQFVYALAGAFAHNTGRIFIGDPAGLSDDALRRRPENMLSLALKYGTTKFLAPHPRQIVGAPSLGVPPLKWVYGDDVGNLHRLIALNTAAVENAFPAIKNIEFDLETGTFRNTATGRRVPVGFLRGGVHGSADEGAGGHAGAAKAGSRTYARAVLWRALAKLADGARSGDGSGDGRPAGVLGALSDTSRVHAKGELKGLFSRSDRQSGVAPDDLQALAARVAASLPNAPKIHVLSHPRELGDADLQDALTSSGAWGDVEAVLWKGEIFAFAEHLDSLERAEHVLAEHEIAHAGLRSMLGKALTPAMQALYNLNASIRKAADAKIKAEGLPLRIAVEEVLVDIPTDQLPKLQGWRKFVQRLADGLRGRGYERLALALDRVLLAGGQELAIAGLAGELVHAARGWMAGSEEAKTAGRRGALRLKALDAALQPDGQGVGRAELVGGLRMSRRSMGERAADLFSAVTAPDFPGKVQDFVMDRMHRIGTFNPWHKSVGTQFHKAKINKHFGRVYRAAQAYINDVSFFANEAGNLAPSLLPKLDKLGDLLKRLALTKEDETKVAKALFDGTLQERVLSPSELRDEFGLNDEQIGLYKEFRAAVDRSLDLLVAGDVLRQLGRQKEEMPPHLPELVRRGQFAEFGAEVRKTLREQVQKHEADLAALAKEQVRERANLAARKRRALEQATVTSKLAIQQRFDEEARQLAFEQGAPRYRAEEKLKLWELLESQAIDKFVQIENLKDKGYAPLMRFGKFAIRVEQPGQVPGEEPQMLSFHMRETRSEANRLVRELRAKHPDAEVSVSVAQQLNSIYSGMDPEVLSLFADHLELKDGQREAFEQYVKLATSNRSAMKRLLKRKGVPGYSEEVTRVLAAFITSNARQTSAAVHMGELDAAVDAIPKTLGDVKDEAIRLRDYIKVPTEEAQRLRGLMFVWFIGGSIASAIANMTQPVTMTYPWLTQFAGPAGAAKAMAQAGKDLAELVTNDKAVDADLQQALKRADLGGKTSPSEIHQMQAEVSKGVSHHPGLRRLLFTWGVPFQLAEQFNRRVTFIAAYRVARENKKADPYAFAVEAVDETQGIYDKANRPDWARGAIGATLFTFKQFSIHYMEWLVRMWKAGEPGSQERRNGRRAVLIALGVLVMVAGVQGLPGADDLDDVIDAIGQTLGYDTNSKRWKDQVVQKTLGLVMPDSWAEDGADYVLRGLSVGTPIDVAGRLGLGNLIPGTGVLPKKEDRSRDLAELAGPAGSLVESSFRAARSALEGDLWAAIKQGSPKAVSNLVAGARMFFTGEYEDSRDREVIKTDNWDALAKLIGFQPSKVAAEQRLTAMIQQSNALHRLVREEIAHRWAAGIKDGDQDRIKEAQEALAEWNRKNPKRPMEITRRQLTALVRQMSMSKRDRLLKGAPRELRGQTAEELGG